MHYLWCDIWGVLLYSVAYYSSSLESRSCDTHVLNHHLRTLWTSPEEGALPPCSVGDPVAASSSFEATIVTGCTSRESPAGLLLQG